MCIRDRGTNAAEGKEIIDNSGLSVISAISFADAAEAVRNSLL